MVVFYFTFYCASHVFINIIVFFYCVVSAFSEVKDPSSTHKLLLSLFFTMTWVGK